VDDLYFIRQVQANIGVEEGKPIAPDSKKRPGFARIHKYLYGADGDAKEKKGHSKGNLNRNASIVNNMYDKTFEMIQKLDNGLSADLPYEDRKACWDEHLYPVPCPDEDNYPTKDVFQSTKMYPTVHLLG
jgi:hypothetical protein